MGRAIARFLVVTIVITLTLADLAVAEQRPPAVRLPHTQSDSIAVKVVVTRGDHLWKISERHLEELMGREPSGAEVSPYWRQVIEVNRKALRSGDPDLIYPGEVVTLPPFSARP
ncbi:MAG: LysM peptidoglycan-binding domain-containing protein [Acidimicrobiia bacterium]